MPIQILRTVGNWLDPNRMKFGQLGFKQGSKRLCVKGKGEGELFDFPSEEEIEKIIQARVNAAVNEAVANLAFPIPVGKIDFVLSATLPNDSIISIKQWWWLRLDLFSGTIGSVQSSADLKDDRLERLFLAWGGTASQWENGEAIDFPDFRGRVVGVAGQGTGLSSRAIGETIGEEKHTLTIGEMPNHNHGGGNHRHGGVGIPYSNTQQAGGPGGCNWSHSSYSGNIIAPQGSNQTHNNMQPSIFFAHLCFLGVQI